MRGFVFVKHEIRNTSTKISDYIVATSYFFAYLVNRISIPYFLLSFINNYKQMLLS